jgi:hypothetical protein
VGVLLCQEGNLTKVSSAKGQGRAQLGCRNMYASGSHQMHVRNAVYCMKIKTFLSSWEILVPSLGGKPYMLEEAIYSVKWNDSEQRTWKKVEPIV